MEFIKKNKNYIIWAGCAVMAIAVFLTFVKMSASAYGVHVSESVKFTELTKDGNEIKAISAYFVLIAAAATAVLIYLKKEKYSLISTAAALFIAVYDWIKVKDNLKDLGSSVKLSYVAPWVVIIGVVLAAGPIVIELLEEKGVIKKK